MCVCVCVCVYISHFLYPFIHQWIQVVSILCYCEQYCNDHGGAYIFSNLCFHFLWVNTIDHKCEDLFLYSLFCSIGLYVCLLPAPYSFGYSIFVIYILKTGSVIPLAMFFCSRLPTCGLL